MHEELWQQLEALDRQKTSKRAICKYMLDPERYIVKLLNTEYQVNLTENRIFAEQSSKKGETAAFLEQLCLLSYLINAKQLPTAKNLVNAKSLPGGEFFFRGSHILPTEKMKKAFGKNPDLLYESGVSLDAKSCDFGDASVELFVLPRIPITFIIWANDDEFSSRASVLFDKTASEHLPLDALLTAVNLAVDALTKNVKSNN